MVCYSCGKRSPLTVYCGECKIRTCDHSVCMENHRMIHERVLWNRRLDEITSDPQKWQEAVDRVLGA